MKVDVTGGGYADAAAALDAGADRAATAWAALSSGLGAAAGMGGDDTTSERFVAAYDDGAREVFAAIGGLTVALAGLRELTVDAATRHLVADLEAHLGHPGGGEAFAHGTGERGPVPPWHPAPPSARGADAVALPPLWDHVVDHLEGLAWPSADVDRLRTAAALWRRTSGRVADLSPSLAVAAGALRAQRSPEVPLALASLAEVDGHVGVLAEGCADLAAACEDYADQVEATRAAVTGLLRDLAVELGFTAFFSAVGSTVTFGGAAAVGGTVMAARVAVVARRVLLLLRELRAVRAVETAARTLPRARSVGTALEKYDNIRTARSIARRVDEQVFSPGRNSGDLHARMTNLIHHFSKHGGQFPDARDADEYAAFARFFLREPPPGTWTRIKTSVINGVEETSVLRYHPPTNTYASMSSDGSVRTMFRPDQPDNMAYFLNW